MNPWLIVIFTLCLAALLWIGWRSRRPWSSSNEYLNASRSISLWAAALAFMAYNCGSIEVIGMSAMAAQYGVQAFHFYWVGGVPGIIFMGLVVLPVYMRTGAHSVPEYLGMRFGSSVRLLNACVSIVGTVCFSGVALYTLAQVLRVILGWPFITSELGCTAVVLIYVLAGGVRASILTSVFQLFVMIAGLTPLFFFTFQHNAETWAHRSDRWHLWKPLPFFAPHASLDCVGVLLGLGFVISFSYWCTDFVMIQRALTARTIEDARKVPLLAGFGKMAMAFLIVLPGVAGPVLLRNNVSFDQMLPALIALEFGPALLALGTAALLGGLMSWLAGNVSGFSALWVEEIHRRLMPNCSERYYIRTGHFAALACLLIAQSTAYAAFAFHDIMEFLQLIVAFFYAPVFAVVIGGLFSRRTSERGAFTGICTGILSASALQAAFSTGFISFGSQMNADFYEAILSFSVAICTCLFMWKASGKADANSIWFDGELRRKLRPSPSLALLSGALVGLCVILNIIWW